MDWLELTTSRGRTVGWGGPGGAPFLLFDAAAVSALQPSSGRSGRRGGGQAALLALAGGRGGHLHHLAAVSSCAAAAAAPTPGCLPPAWAVSAAYGHLARPALRRAVAAFAAAAAASAAAAFQGGDVPSSEADGSASSATALAATAAAVRAAGRYASNLAAKGFGASGGDGRVRAVRAANTFCDAKLGGQPGGLALLAAAGFAKPEWRLPSAGAPLAGPPAAASRAPIAAAAAAPAAADDCGLFLVCTCPSADDARALGAELEAIARAMEKAPTPSFP